MDRRYSVFCDVTDDLAVLHKRGVRVSKTDTTWSEPPRVYGPVAWRTVGEKPLLVRDSGGSRGG